MSAAPPASVESAAPARLARWAPLALVAATLLAYARVVQAPFLFDDHELFDDLGALAPLRAGSRPLVWASMALCEAISGRDPWSYHALNVLVHAAAAVLLFSVAVRVLVLALGPERTGLARQVAFLTALLWTVHPLQTESVAYVSQRAEALSGLFTLAFLAAFLRSTDAARPRRWKALALVSLALGMASKELVAVAPLLALLVDRTLVSGSLREALRRHGGFHALAFLLVLGLSVALVAPHLFGSASAGFTLHNFGPLEYARTQPGVVLHYLRLAFWPHPLCLDYGWPIASTTRAIVPPALALSALLAATLWALARNHPLGLAGLWFFALLAPTSSIVPIKDPAFEHRMYLALAPVLLLAVLALGRLLGATAGGRRLATGLGLALAALALVATWRRNEDYRSAVHMWESVVALRPSNGRAHTNLGMELLEADRPQDARPVLERALELDASDGHAWLNLGTARLLTGDAAGAVECHRHAVELLGTANAHRNLAHALFQTHDYEGARAEYEAALAAGSPHAIDHYFLANCLQQLGRNAEAVPHYEAFLAAEPEHSDAHGNLGVSLSALGRREEALEHFRKAVELPPEAPTEHFNLGRCLASLGREAQALEEYRSAMRLAPDMPEPCDAAARLLSERAGATSSDLAEARQLAERAVQSSQGKRPEFLETLAAVHAAAGEPARAVEVLERALALASSGRTPGLARRIAAELERYRGLAGGR